MARLELPFMTIALTCRNELIPVMPWRESEDSALEVGTSFSNYSETDSRWAACPCPRMRRAGPRSLDRSHFLGLDEENVG